MAGETSGPVDREGAGAAAAWVREAIEAAKRGDRFLALQCLEQALQEDPDHEAALLWKAGLTADRQEAIWCLRRVLAKDPHNARARAGLAWFQQQEAEEAPTMAPPEPTPETRWEEEQEEAAEAVLEEGPPELPEAEISIPPFPEPQREAEREEVDWLRGRLERREEAIPRKEREPEVQEERVPAGEAPRLVPSIVDELRAGVLAEEAAAEKVARPAAQRMGGAEWLILALLAAALCGLVGIIAFLVLRQEPAASVPTAVVVETQVRAARPDGDAAREPAVTDASSRDLSILQVRYVPGDERVPSRLLGEVANNSSRLLGDLQAELTVYNSAGEVVLRQPGLVARRLLAPGTRSPFEVVLRQVPAPSEWYSVRVVAQAVGSEVLEFWPEVAVPVHEAQNLGGGKYRIKGEVVNQATFPAEQVEVVCTLYAGEEETIAAMALANVEPLTLEPGGRGTFAVEVQVSEALEVSGYRLFAQGFRAQER